MSSLDNIVRPAQLIFADADVQVGDHVLAYDFDTDSTVGREVTATLPHTDWLLEAHFSDGTVMDVTEDHRFWSVTDDDWVELQDLDTSDVLLSPDAATVTVDFLDWDAGVTTDAYDLTVDQEHNFFVTADPTGEPMLVHNQTRGTFCGVRISSQRFLDSADELVAVEEALGPLADDVGDLLRRLTNSSSQATIDRVVDGLVAVSGSPTAVRQLGRNLLVDDDFLRTVPEMSQELFGQVFAAVDIGSLPREARSLLVSSGTSSVDAIRLQNRFGIEIRPTTPWGAEPTAAESASFVEEIANANARIAGNDRVEYLDASLSENSFPRAIDGSQPPNPSRRPDYLINGRHVDAFTPRTATANNAISNLLNGDKVFGGQSQRIDIVIDRVRTPDLDADDLQAALDRFLELEPPDSFLFDPARPLEELTVWVIGEAPSSRVTLRLS